MLKIAWLKLDHLLLAVAHVLCPIQFCFLIRLIDQGNLVLVTVIVGSLKSLLWHYRALLLTNEVLGQVHERFG